MYIPTRHSNALRSPENSSKAFKSLPEFFKHTHYKDPTSADHTNWHYASGRDQSFFQFLRSNLDVGKNFGTFMAGYTSQRAAWVDVYPGRAILDNADAEASLVVDMVSVQLRNVPLCDLFLVLVLTSLIV